MRIESTLTVMVVRVKVIDMSIITLPSVHIRIARYR